TARRRRSSSTTTAPCRRTATRTTCPSSRATWSSFPEARKRAAMATHVIAPPMTETSDGLGMTRVLAVIRRRRALAILPFLFIFAAAASLALFLPNVWTTQAVILVDPEQVPDAFVKTTAPADRERQVLSLTQQILSRPRLEEALARIYRVRTPVPSAAVDRMRRDIKVD